jgi:hypothetical protein
MSPIPNCARARTWITSTASAARFVTVLPRTRLEDQEFCQWIQTNTPAWELVWDQPNPRHRDGPRDRWSVYRAPLLSAEVWPIVWVWSNLLTLHQAARRRRNIAAAIEAFGQLRERLAGAKTRHVAARLPMAATGDVCGPRRRCASAGFVTDRHSPHLFFET